MIEQWHWREAHKESVEEYRKKNAVLIDTVNDIEIWQNRHGVSVLLKKAANRNYLMSSINFWTIEEAIKAIKNI